MFFNCSWSWSLGKKFFCVQSCQCINEVLLIDKCCVLSGFGCLSVGMTMKCQHSSGSACQVKCLKTGVCGYTVLNPSIIQGENTASYKVTTCISDKATTAWYCNSRQKLTHLSHHHIWGLGLNRSLKIDCVRFLYLPYGAICEAILLPRLAGYSQSQLCQWLWQFFCGS